ncbi:hypothetical protein [Coleofasciculus sp. FACHB-1120]|uniref:hypothetical protein n=1 Tax=Coleofasciculus sp. FACHB-1120 TaxID=2692783 RepID=UPI00168323B3|nr:hypothetical protein [Coleofasciculus sp. FACHB-1120]MBD2741093.1 hypothetical protein [Coleofasciculus sp. FACHB-1120]
MQRIFSALGQAFRNGILILVTVSLLSLSNLFIFANQPAYAASNSSPKQALADKIERADNNGEDSGLREQAYEEAAEQARNPEKQAEIYNESVKANKGPQAENGLIEGAKELVEKVTGQGDSN